jgi:hypothetical protein
LLYIGKNKFTNEQLNFSCFFTYPDERDETNETYNEDETDETDLIKGRGREDDEDDADETNERDETNETYGDDETDETDESDETDETDDTGETDETDEADYETDNSNPSIVQRVDVLENQVELLQDKFEKYALANYTRKFNDNEVKHGNWVDG